MEGNGSLMRDRLAEVGFSGAARPIVATVSGDIDGSNAAELRRAVAERVPSTAQVSSWT